MADYDDFLDDYIGYRIFEESLKKGSGGGKTPKCNTGGSGCSFWLIIIIILALALSALGSCGKSSSKYSPGSYSTSSHITTSRSYYSGGSYSNSSSSSRSYLSGTSKPFSGYSSGNKSKSNSSDPYDAKSYAHPDDFYYDYYDDFWDFENAEDYYYNQSDN